MGIKVKRDRPSRRLHHRVTAPLFVTVGGHTMRAADWSLGGLRVESFPGTLPSVGDEVDLHISLPFQGFEVAFDAQGEIVRTGADEAMFALKFTELGERERELMSHFVEEIVRGSMVDVEDTIQRIDVPVTPVSTKPDPNPKQEVPVRRLPIKTITMSTFYLLLGFFVFGYVGVMVYANYFRMEIQTAVMSAPLESVKAQFAGRIVWSDFRPGEEVKTGDIILHVADNDLEKEIDFARIDVNERKAQLDYLRRKQADELDRMKGLADIGLKKVRQTNLEVEALAAEAKAAEALNKRLSSLLEEGYTTRSRAEEAEAAFVLAKKKLESRQLELQSSINLAKSHIGRRHYTGTNFVGEVGKIDAEIVLAENQIGIASSRHESLLKHRGRLAVRAPFDGVLFDLPRVNMAAVRHGDIVAIVEQRRARHVTAYLKQDEVIKVGLGDRAFAYIPALSETHTTIVTEIDRTKGFVDEQRSSYKWRGSRDRSARVVLEFEFPELVEDARRYRSGLPIVVLFEQRATNQIISEIRRRLNMLFVSVGGPIRQHFRATPDVPSEDGGLVRNSSFRPERSYEIHSTAVPTGRRHDRAQMMRLLGLRSDGRLSFRLRLPVLVRELFGTPVERRVPGTHAGSLRQNLEAQS